MLQLSCYKVWEGLGSWSLFQNFHPTLPTHIRQLQTGWKSWLYKYAHLKAEKDTVDNMSHQINTAENKKQTYIIGLKQLGHSKEGFSSFHDTKVLPLEDIWKEGNPSYHNQLWACCRCLCKFSLSYLVYEIQDLGEDMSTFSWVYGGFIKHSCLETKHRQGCWHQHLLENTFLSGLGHWYKQHIVSEVRQDS